MKKNNKGFTLAELLIVVAIIAVLVAVAIPVFSTQLERSKEATDTANVRSAYAQVVTSYLTDGAAHSMSVEARQGQSGWQNKDNGKLVTQINGKESVQSFSAVIKGGKYNVAIKSDGTVSVTEKK